MDTVTTPTHVRLYLAGLEQVEIRFGDVVITGHGSQAATWRAPSVSTPGGPTCPPSRPTRPLAADNHDAAGRRYFEISLPAAYFECG
ncbi:MAG: hypothetical protein R2851_07105 [Caldilineaceae bacterium]